MKPIIDIRGEPCGMPVLRVERYLLKKSGNKGFKVYGDDEQTMDQLRMLALKHGWACEVAREGEEWRADFLPGAAPP